MEYKPLKITKYSNESDYESEYSKRINSFGIIKTKMYPTLMKRGVNKGRDFPLFVVPLLELQIITQQIQEKSIIIKELADQLPEVAKHQFYKEQLYKAIINTNEIEGVKTTRREVSEAYNAVLNRSQNEKIRLLSTVRMYHDILLNNVLKIDSIETIRSIYDELTKGEIEKGNELDGDYFRNDYVTILDQNSGKLEHLPPVKETTIMLMLTSWLTFINDKTIPFLIKASLAHFFFENVHPFYGGNGRTGRYILSRYLSRKLDIYSGLVISQKINENKKKYYDAFKITGDYDNRAEGTFFVLYLLELLKDGQDDIIGILDSKKAILDDAFNTLESRDDLTPIQKHILFLVFQSTEFVDDPKEGIKDNEIIDILSRTYPKKTIKDNIKRLRENTIITKTTKAPSRHTLNSVKLFND
ncbi:Fic family protein [Streptococcus halichoeri]|uniref:Fic family protein n=1 Tax=Streptococcus halichoeri TaxID=254785 RepID=UPI0013597343|nr:Fic family protein [Streptococcus halichoeri]